MLLLNKVRLANFSKNILGLASFGLVLGGINAIFLSQIAHGAPDDSSYKMVWQDEFNGNSLNSKNWGYQTGAWNSSGVQNCYKESPNNVAVNNGTLKITARHEPGTTCGGQKRDFTSGFVQTAGKQFWTYGYFEARIKMPGNNASTWPAFWMSPNQATYGSWPRSGEIDIVETKGSDLKYLAADAHWGEGNERNKRRNRPAKTEVDSTANWHTYAVKWQEGRLDYYVDGRLYHTINKFDTPNATAHPGPFNKPFYLRLNVAVGGSYIEKPYNDANNSIKNFPATMEVDYVRVYQKTNNNTPAPTPKPKPEDPKPTPQPEEPKPSPETQPNHQSVVNSWNEFIKRIKKFFGF